MRLIGSHFFPSFLSKLSGSFETVYELLPLLVQGFILSKTEGALFKCLDEGQDPADSRWNIFLKDGKTFKRIASQASRPDDEELELALYNNQAENNPLIKGIKSLKNAFSKDE